MLRYLKQIAYNFPPPPKKHSHVPSNCTLGRGTLSFPWVYARNLHLPLNHYIFRPFPTKLETWMKHGKIVWKQLYLFKTMLICRVYGGRHHLLQLAPPPPHQKGFADICRILQGFCFFLKVWVYFEERNHAVKHGVKLLGTAFTFQKHANMHRLWGSTSLITITTPPHHIHFGGRNHAVHGEICLEIALPSQNHANMQSLWGSTSLITISPPPLTTPKRICRILQGSCLHWKNQLCFGRRTVR